MIASWHKKDFAFKSTMYCLRMALMLSCFLFNNLLKAQLPGDLIQDTEFNKYSSSNAKELKAGHYYVISFKENDCQTIHEVKIIRRINSRIAIIQLRDGESTLNKSNCIEKWAPANNLWKLSPSFEKWEFSLLSSKNTTIVFTIIANDIDALLASFQQKQIAIETISIFRETNAAVIKCKAKTFIKDCLEDANLIFADLYQTPSTNVFVSGYNRSFNTINLADYLIPNANGRGIVIGIKERLMDQFDIDLQKRVLPSILASTNVDYHSTVTSTLAGGAGNSFYTGKGIAFKCNFFPSTFSNIFPDSSLLLVQKNVSVQNHSYGTVLQSFYGAEALSYDVQTSQNKTLLHVFSSGNKGTESAFTGTYQNLNGFANLTGNFKMAKNIVTVAAVDTSGNLTAFSSSGPLYDGRLGPQITALGPNGTSEAAAIVSGAAAILQQVYKDSNSQSYPPASLIKAILFNTADDIGRKGIDYHSGFGLLNIFNAVNCLQQKKYDGSELQQAAIWTKNISIPSQTANLKITLSWTDTAATINTNKALVNDLDLELVELNSGTVYKPWQLSVFPNIDSLNKLPVRKRDSLNTAEQISIDFPVAGNYQIKVTAIQIQTNNKQAFYISYNWDTLNTLRFTNPVHASDVDRLENPNLSIKWKVADADTNTTGNLAVSFDNGINWQTINTGIKIYKQSFNWAIPNISTVAQLRMECSFGNFYSERFVIAPHTKLNVDYHCTDSVRLSWQKHFSAINYQLFALADTAFMKPILVTTDTFVVLKKNIHPQDVFAVQPLLSSGLPAARSVAIDIRHQGVSCFYKTLLGDRIGDSIELNLEMSFLQGVANIEFQKLTSTGALIKIMGSYTPITGQLTYLSFDASPFSGMNYYKAKITINGGAVYTDIVGLFHNGKKLVIVYPNPATKGQVINFRMKESLGTGNLLITDMTGRVVSKFFMNTSAMIKSGSWPAGVYVFKLSNTKGNIIETGKFIIQ